MKWLFLLFLVALVPALTVWLRENRVHAPKVWMLIGFLPFTQAPWNLYIAPISWAHWPGYVKGLEVSLLDAIALAVYLSLPPSRSKLPFRLAFGAYIFASFLSIFQAETPMASFFYVWQLGRAFLLYATVVKICADERGPSAIITGLVVGLGIQAYYSILGRIGGRLQVGGTFGHQNLLGMISYFVALPTFAMLLAGWRGWAPRIGPPAGLIIAVLTASRATIGFGLAGFVLVFLLSCLRRWTPRKGVVAMCGCLALAAAAPFAYSSLQQRYAGNPTSGDEERAAFERAALMISADYPMGVGANQYVVVANTQGYSARAGVAWNWGSRAANVHHVYLLILAETGYLGLITFIILLGRVIVTAFRCAWRNRGAAAGDLLLGLGVALTIAAIHSLYEWAFVTFHVQYMFAIAAGIVAALAQRLGYWGGPVSKGATPAAIKRKPLVGVAVHRIAPKHRLP